MFERTKNGAIRPMYVGTIKNNFIRRLLCYGLSPITLVLCIVNNFAKWLLWVVLQLAREVVQVVFILLTSTWHLFMCFYVPIKGMLTTHTVWHAPRGKDE